MVWNDIEWSKRRSMVRGNEQTGQFSTVDEIVCAVHNFSRLVTSNFRFFCGEREKGRKIKC